jgi:endonuclease/exonuclease/phosphatase family metal-dependent hydrolase
MKLISLNTWGGRAGKEILLDFIKKHEDIDVFCLQEIWNGGEHMGGKVAGGVALSNIDYRLLTDIGHVLKVHDVYLRPHYHDWYGLAIFVKKSLKVVNEGETYVYKEKRWMDKTDTGNHARNIQWITLETKKGLMTIINIHGIWTGMGKNDSEDRLRQSEKIIEFTKTLNNPFIIAGDFNLTLETESIKKLERAGMKNLIKEYGIKSTRTELYKKTAEKFADYIFVSAGVIINRFEILNDIVSDHSPMLLDFQI